MKIIKTHIPWIIIIIIFIGLNYIYISYIKKHQNELPEAINILLSQQEMLQNQLININKEIASYEVEHIIARKTPYELEQLKEQIGLTTKMGTGVSIFIDDSPKVQNKSINLTDPHFIHAVDLRDIVNLLQIAKAEAISINRQRIVPTTAIICVGNNILINNINLTPPFVIEAIGDPIILMSHLREESLLSSLYTRKNNYGLIFSYKKHHDLIIPPYNGRLYITKQ